MRKLWRTRVTLGERIVWTVGIVGTFGLALYSMVVEGHL
jgi:hypothetical protein